MSAVSSTSGINRSSHSVAVRHSQVRHPVQRRTPDQQLRRLSLKLARAHSLAEDHLHSKDLRLSQRTAMIARRALPLSTPLAPNLSQVLITDMPFSFRVAVLPNLRPLLWRNSSSRLSLSNRVITVATVIRAIGTHLLDLVCDLRKQVLKQLRVLEVVGRDHDRDKLMGRFVHAEMKFAPRAAARVPVLAHFPLAFAVDLDAGGVHYHVQWLGVAKARQLNRKCAAATTQRRVTGHTQLDTEQLHDRARQPFGGAQRQAVDLFESSHAEDGDVGIGGRLAALARAGLVVPCRKNLFADPDGQTSPLDKSFVILTPVTETVRAFGFLLGHTSRLPALPSP